MAKIEFVGVDSCPYGWFSVGLSTGNEYELKIFQKFRDLLDHYSQATLILVDMPIGFSEGMEERLCDPQARKKLGKLRSSVFRAPARATVEHAAKNHGANDCDLKNVEREHSGKSLSIQTLCIIPKIVQVHKSLTDSQAGERPKVREVHPEICFWALNKRTHLKSKKKTEAGRNERTDVLRKLECRTDEIYKKACEKYRRRHVQRDDILDALVAAVTAHKGHRSLKKLPENLCSKDDDQPPEMVLWVPDE